MGFSTFRLPSYKVLAKLILGKMRVHCHKQAQYGVSNFFSSSSSRTKRRMLKMKVAEGACTWNKNCHSLYWCQRNGKIISWRETPSPLTQYKALIFRVIVVPPKRCWEKVPPCTQLISCYIFLYLSYSWRGICSVMNYAYWNRNTFRDSNSLLLLDSG